MTPDQELPELTDGEVVERINKIDLQPMFDTNHIHQYVPDPDDETDDYLAEVCSVKGCWMGRLIAK